MLGPIFYEPPLNSPPIENQEAYFTPLFPYRNPITSQKSIPKSPLSNAILRVLPQSASDQIPAAPFNTFIPTSKSHNQPKSAHPSPLLAPTAHEHPPTSPPTEYSHPHLTPSSPLQTPTISQKAHHQVPFPAPIAHEPLPNPSTIQLQSSHPTPPHHSRRAVSSRKTTA